MRFHIVRGWCVTAAVVSIAAAGIVAAPVARAATGTTLLMLSAEAGNKLMPATTETYRAADTDFNVQLGAGSESSIVTQGAAVHRWSLLLDAPAGQDLVAGTTYSDAQMSPAQMAPHPGISLFGDGLACASATGSFTVLEYAPNEADQTTSRLAVTFTYYCQGSTVPVRGALYYNSTLPYSVGAALTLDGPASLPGGVTVSITGSLSDGTAPVAGALLAVSRTDASGMSTLPGVVSGADGSFTVRDTMPASNAIYRVDFAGDLAVQALSADHAIVDAPYPSTLTAAAPTTATRGTAYHVSGVLSSPDGTALPGTSLSVTRSDLAGTRTTKLVTGPGGAYSVRDVPAVGGPVRWALSFAGDATHHAVAVNTMVTVARTATTLSIATSAKTYAYGARAVLTVHLGPTYNGRTVSLYALPVGSKVKAPGILIAHGPVNRAGTFVATYRILGKATFTARFAGDYRYAPVARSVSRWVQSTVTVRAVGAVGRSGIYSVFSGGVAPLLGSSKPVRKLGCMGFTLQQLRGSTWRTIDNTRCVRIDTTGVARTAVLHGARGGKYRVRASLPTDAVSLGSSTPWLHFTFR